MSGCPWSKAKELVIGRLAQPIIRIWRIVSKLVFFQEVAEASIREPVHAFGEPETHDLFDSLSDIGISPVEVRLRRKKGVVAGPSRSRDASCGHGWS
jgi:hypothetical protein